MKRTFDQFSSWLKAMNRYEFFVSMFLGDDKLQDFKDFYKAHGENSLFAMSEVAPTIGAHEECRRLAIFYDGYVNGYPVYEVGMKKTVVAALYKSDDTTSIHIHEFMDMYPDAEFDEDCYAVYAYNLEKVLKVR